MKGRGKAVRRGFFAAAMLLSTAGVLFCAFHLWKILSADKETSEYYAALSQKSGTAGGREIDFAALREVNPDVVAWLWCPDTPIDYPIVQRDQQFYLKHRFDGQYSDYGALFLDSRNAADFSDQQSLVYGHNMHHGDTMLTSLMNYQRQDYYDAHPALTLFTPEGRYTVELFSGYLTKDLAQIFWAEADGQDAEKLEAVQAGSCFESGVHPSGDDRFLTLCTCAYFERSERMVLWGRLVPEADGPKAAESLEAQRIHA